MCPRVLRDALPRWCLPARPRKLDSTIWSSHIRKRLAVNARSFTLLTSCHGATAIEEALMLGHLPWRAMGSCLGMTPGQTRRLARRTM